MPSACTLQATVGLHVTVPCMPVSQSWKKKVCLWHLRKKIVCFWSGRKKMLCFLAGRKKIIWLRKKTIPSPLVLNGPPLRAKHHTGTKFFLASNYPWLEFSSGSCHRIKTVAAFKSLLVDYSLSDGGEWSKMKVSFSVSSHSILKRFLWNFVNPISSHLASILKIS